MQDLYGKGEPSQATEARLSPLPTGLRLLAIPKGLTDTRPRYQLAVLQVPLASRGAPPCAGPSALGWAGPFSIHLVGPLVDGARRCRG